MAAKKSEKDMTQKEKAALIDIKIDELGQELVKEIEAGQNPHLDIPIRGSGNVFYDQKAKQIMLGDKIAKRYLFNVAHSRRFMQTLLVASYVKKDLLANNLTATLRDLYYAKKHTIAGTKEDTIDEQKESDGAIVDLEVSLDTFRERLHLRAEPKGRMAGTLKVKDRVRDKVDTIDLERMGSGGWAVPSIVEQIEFVDSEIEYVLVAEKNAIFDRLNEDDYWKKNKCLLMTTAGQAARGARRLLQRISSELKVPIYCLSVDADEPVLIQNEDGLLTHPRIGQYSQKQMAAYGLTRDGYYQTSLSTDQAYQMNPDFSTHLGQVTNVIRHPVHEPLFEVVTEGGSSCRVTGSHSLMVFNTSTYSLEPKPTNELKIGEFLASPSTIPNFEGLESIDLVEAIDKAAPELKKSLEVKSNKIRWANSKFWFNRQLKLNQTLARLLGYYVSEGSISEDGVVLTFGPTEQDLADDAVDCAKKSLGLSGGSIYRLKDSIRVVFGGKLGVELFSTILGCGKNAETKSIPDAIYNTPNRVKQAFLYGCFIGDGHFSQNRLKLTTISRKLAADVTLLIKQLRGVSTIKKYASTNKNSSEYYQLFVSDKSSLLRLSKVTYPMMRKAGISEESITQFKKRKDRESKYSGVPKELVTPLGETIRRMGGLTIGRLLANSPKHLIYEKLETVLDQIQFDGSTGQKANRVFNELSPSIGLTQKELALKTGLNKQTLNSCLRQLAKLGCAIKGKSGTSVWLKGPVVFIEPEKAAKIYALKQIVKQRMQLLPVKQLENVESSDGYVYDLSIPPAHTFLCGLGTLCAHNTDSDPYGWYIFSTMKYGSMALAHESERLGCPEMKFLGMSCSDIEHYDLSSVTIKAKDVDIKRAQELKGYDWFKPKEWQSEINLFLEKKLKAEIQALSSKNLQYISKEYLPDKIKAQDFLP